MNYLFLLEINREIKMKRKFTTWKIQNQNELEQEIAFRYAQNFDYERLQDLKTRKIPNSINEFSDDVYKELYLGFYHASGQGSDLRKLKEQGILNPPEKVIQEVYEAFAKRGNVWGIEDVFIATAIEPKVTNESAQKGYIELVFGYNADSAVDLHKYLNIEPQIKKGIVQKLYQKYLGTYRLLDGIEQLPYLKELTGIEAKIPIEMIIEASNYLDKLHLEKHSWNEKSTYKQAKIDLLVFFGLENYEKTKEDSRIIKNIVR
jgi:hypothetical protein